LTIAARQSTSSVAVEELDLRPMVDVKVRI